MESRIAWLVTAILGLGAMTAEAAEMSLSGFGTLGYAQSNQAYNFERFINNNGTIKRDSVAGVQADVKFTDQIGATVQGKFAPSLNSDTAWAGTLSWAFLSWRPTNDWLIRLGKQRIPVYLYSESQDVGGTYDFAHLPDEMYSISPSTDYIGISLSKTWTPSLGELTLDGYAGNIKTDWRIYQRDNIQIPGSPQYPGANFKNISADSGGFALTLLRDEDKYRASIHKQTTTINPYSPAYLSLLPAAGFAPGIIPSITSQLVLAGMSATPGLGVGVSAQDTAAAAAGTLGGSAYTVLPQAEITTVNSLVYTFSAEINMPEDFRVIGEYGRRKITNGVTGIDTSGGYLALLKEVDAWTPYVSYALIKSRSDLLSQYQAVNSNPGLTVAPSPLAAIARGAAAGINASQRVLADGMLPYDQYTVALGTSYRLTPKQKIKFEWARTHVGVASSFVDAPSGGNVSNQNINVLSLSYNFVF